MKESWRTRKKEKYVYGLEELIVLTFPYYPNESTVTAIPMKVPMALFTETEKIIQKFI